MKTILPAKTAEMLITQKCNLQCTYCFETCKSFKNLSFEETIKRLTGQNTYSTLPVQNFYLFGGEPLMNFEFISKIIDWVINASFLSGTERKTLLSSICSNLITNGVLIDKFIDKIKEHNIALQISLDGPRDVNDSCRIDAQGKGYFDRIQENIKLCRENNIPYTLHGAICRTRYKDFARINKWYLEQAINNTSCNLVNVFYHNYLQIVFEDEISDEDIDCILEQFFKTVEIIMTTPMLDDKPSRIRKEIAEGFLNRRGGICSAGYTMFSYDEDFNVFPCHRINTDEYLKSNKLTNLVEESEYNFKYYIQYQEVAKRGIQFGPYLNNNGHKRSGNYWLNWCPATAWEVSNNVFYIPAKYDVLEAELQRFIPLLADYFDLDIQNPKFNN